MPDEQSIWERFRKEILEFPDDDPPRLAFAAALEEEEDGNVRHPREQATFIRTQLKLARIHAGHPEWLALSTREQLLLNRYGGDWLPFGLRQSAVSEARYFRGIVSHLTLRAFASVDFNPQVLQETPIEHIDIIGIDQTFTFESTLNWLAGSGLSDRTRSLALDAQELSDRDAKLLTSIGFPRLKWLSLTDNKIGQSGVAVLIERFRTLHFVDLDGNPGDPHDTFEYDQGIVIERVPGRVPTMFPGHHGSTRVSGAVASSIPAGTGWCGLATPASSRRFRKRSPGSNGTVNRLKAQETVWIIVRFSNRPFGNVRNLQHGRFGYK